MEKWDSFTAACHLQSRPLSGPIKQFWKHALKKLVCFWVFNTAWHLPWYPCVIGCIAGQDSQIALQKSHLYQCTRNIYINSVMKYQSFTAFTQVLYLIALKDKKNNGLFNYASTPPYARRRFSRVEWKTSRLMLLNSFVHFKTAAYP